MSKFNMGDSVMLKNNSDFIAQSRGTAGRILSSEGDMDRSSWARVKWDSGRDDNYPIDDLLPEKVTNWRERLK